MTRGGDLPAAPARIGASARIERWLAVIALTYGSIAMFAATFFYATAFGHDASGSMTHRLATAPAWIWAVSVTGAAVVAAIVAALLSDAMSVPVDGDH